MPAKGAFSVAGWLAGCLPFEKPRESQLETNAAREDLLRPLTVTRVPLGPYEAPPRSHQSARSERGAPGGVDRSARTGQCELACPHVPLSAVHDTPGHEPIRLALVLLCSRCSYVALG